MQEPKTGLDGKMKKTAYYIAAKKTLYRKRIQKEGAVKLITRRIEFFTIILNESNEKAKSAFELRNNKDVPTQTRLEIDN